MPTSDRALDLALDTALNDRRRGRADTSALALIRAADTGARPILASASDGLRYWMKWPGNPHGNLSLAHEVIVANLGDLIGAPVRPTRLVFVDQALTDGEYVDGTALPTGIYVGSEVLPTAEERTSVERTNHDGNPQRFATFLALWELCLGTDLQLLYDNGNQNQVWSIDHGLWFDSQEGDWTEEHMIRRLPEPWPLTDAARLSGLDRTALADVASALVRLPAQAVAAAVAAVPVQWGISDEQLRFLALFVDRRRINVAQRLLDLAEGHERGEPDAF